MNLTTDPWIPVLRSDGSRSVLSLHGLFNEAHTLRDLAVKPHERISLMRLLLCVTQAALDGPADEEEWLESRIKIQSRVQGYLEKWGSGFELFGDGPRFLQLANLEPAIGNEEGNAATKLDLTLSTGNNSTLFDNGAGESRHMTPARIALNLLTFQCFAPGGRIGIARWNGKDTPGNGSSKHAPCTPSSMLHTLVIGATLLDTITRNLLTTELVDDNYPKGRGKPVWEAPVTSVSEADAIENATMTYLGRLVPISRAIRVQESGHSVVLANGLDYPIFPTFREASATIVKRKDELKILPASTGRSIWRQLHAITVKRRADTDQSAGPLTLAISHNTEDRDGILWIGALATSGNGKIEDVIEATYVVPPELFDPFGQAAYERGVQFADEKSTALSKAIGSYAKSLEIDGPAYERARQHFWTTIEQSLDSLFDVARKTTPPDQLGVSPWGRAVHSAALTAYEHSCPRTSSRQIQAYAMGIRYLFASAKSTKTKKTKSKSS